MITNKGKSLIGKYMLGQIPAYSSYIALGCGASPFYSKPTSYSISGSTVTVTFGNPHPFSVDDSIYVLFDDSRVDGLKTILTVGSTTITFTANITIPALTAVDDSNPGVGYALYTAASQHYLIAGDQVTTTGFTDTDFNNTTIDVYSIPSITTFTIVEAGTGTTSTGTLSTITRPTAQIPATAKIYMNAADKQSLDFEMVRIPITSRGLATENGIDMLVFGAETPTQDRFSITEIGIFSAKENNFVTGSQSSMIHTFANFENWELHDSTSSTKILPYSGSVGPTGGATLSLTTDTYATFINADDPVFAYDLRTKLYEKPRMYDSTLILQGDLSNITGLAAGTNMQVSTSGEGSRHVHLLGQNYNFTLNSSSDEIRLAFSVLYRDLDGAYDDAAYVGLIVEFSSDDAGVNAKTARLKIRKTAADLAKSHYFVEKVKLSDLEVSTDFTWSAVNSIKIYCNVESSTDVSSNNYYVAIDALRFENLYDEEQNSSYGMTGYSEIRSTATKGGIVYGIPIEKETNRSSIIEYKFPITIGEA